MVEQQREIPVPDPTVLTTDQLVALEERVMARMDERLGANARLSDEMFTSVTRRFVEMDAHRREQKQDTTKALDAALDAAKNQIGALSLRVDDIRDRITRVEASLEGKQSQVTEARSAKDSTSSVVALGIAAFVAVVGVISFIISIFATGNPATP